MVHTLWKSVKGKKGKLWEPTPKCHRVTHWAGNQKVTTEHLYEFAVTVLSTLPRDTHQFTFSPGGNWCVEWEGVWRCRHWGGGFALWLVPHQRAAPLHWRSSSRTHTHNSSAKEPISTQCSSKCATWMLDTIQSRSPVNCQRQMQASQCRSSKKLLQELINE